MIHPAGGRYLLFSVTISIIFLSAATLVGLCHSSKSMVLPASGDSCLLSSSGRTKIGISQPWYPRLVYKFWFRNSILLFVYVL
jgi:hypothetical protein